MKKNEIRSHNGEMIMSELAYNQQMRHICDLEERLETAQRTNLYVKELKPSADLSSASLEYAISELKAMRKKDPDAKENDSNQRYKFKVTVVADMDAIENTLDVIHEVRPAMKDGDADLDHHPVYYLDESVWFITDGQRIVFSPVP